MVSCVIIQKKGIFRSYHSDNKTCPIILFMVRELFIFLYRCTFFAKQSKEHCRSAAADVKNTKTQNILARIRAGWTGNTLFGSIQYIKVHADFILPKSLNRSRRIHSMWDYRFVSDEFAIETKSREFYTGWLLLNLYYDPEKLRSRQGYIWK